MSIESAKAFYQRVTTDATFRAQLESYPIEERGTFLQAAGYSFTQREWDTTTTEILETTATDGELNEVELEAIAGGKLNEIELEAIAGGKGAVTLYGIPIDYY